MRNYQKFIVSFVIKTKKGRSIIINAFSEAPLRNATIPLHPFPAAGLANLLLSVCLD